ncbi:hypothetical protein [Eisenbergiella tayi]|uniref:hypothetical protein n=1 Tax=Eisenbergiella tayi TaxID=1432052 RepID=UPI0004BC8FE0|nr:hypothetical protein [Eisenbergiella tayi]
MDPEIITLSVCGKLLEIDLENAWVFFEKKNYKTFSRSGQPFLGERQLSSSSLQV